MFFELLSTDEIILNVLSTAKNEGNKLLEHFYISYPNNKVAEESNSIFIACVNSEHNLEGYDFTTFTDLVEILIVTKRRDYKEAVTIIKTVSREICKLLLENSNKFPNKPIIRNINPEFNRDYVLTRGHIMVQVKTEPMDFDVTDDEVNICHILLNNEEINVD